VRGWVSVQECVEVCEYVSGSGEWGDVFGGTSSTEREERRDEK